jgi:DNA-directed RNA polymerase specialized sigma24 family protein
MTEHLLELQARFHDLWARQDYTSAANLIAHDLVPVLRSAANSAGLSHADSEEAVGQAVERFYRKVSRYGEASIAYPWAYLWTATKTAIADCFRKRKGAPLLETTLAVELSPLREPDDLSPPEPEASTPHGLLEKMANAAHGNVPAPSPLLLLESFFEDLEFSESEAPRLVAETISALPASTGRTISAILEHGPEQAALNAMKEGLRPGTYRTRKFRAYQDFKAACPSIAARLNIVWPGID